MSNNAEASRVEPAEANDAIVADIDAGPNTPDQFTPSEHDLPANDTGSGAVSFDKPAHDTTRSRRVDEPELAKRSFLTILDEADVAIRAFDQEKRRILGITYALSQIEQSFERLCAKFEEMERRVDVFTTSNEDLRGRFEASIDSIRTRADREAELFKDNFSLRAALANVERQVAQQADRVMALGNDNAALRRQLAAMECDTGLILDEIGHLRDDITVLSSVSEATVPVSAPPAKPVAAPAVARREEPRAVESVVTPSPQSEPASETADAGDPGDVMSDICSSIAFHMNEAALLRAKIEKLLIGGAAAPAPQKAAPAVSRHEAPVRAPSLEQGACGHELADLKALLKAYQDVIRDLDLSRGAPVNPSGSANRTPVPVMTAAYASPPFQAARGDAGGSTGHAALAPTAREPARPDLSGEWQRERPDHRSVDGASATAHSRARLRRELAQIKAAYTPTIPAEADIVDARPKPEQPAAGRSGLT